MLGRDNDDSTSAVTVALADDEDAVVEVVVVAVDGGIKGALIPGAAQSWTIARDTGLNGLLANALTNTSPALNRPGFDGGSLVWISHAASG